MTEYLGMRPLTPHEANQVFEIEGTVHERYWEQIKAAAARVNAARKAMAGNAEANEEFPEHLEIKALLHIAESGGPQQIRDDLRKIDDDLETVMQRYVYATCAEGLLVGQTMGFKAGVIYISSILQDRETAPEALLKVMDLMADDDRTRGLMAELSPKLFPVKGEE